MNWKNPRFIPLLLPIAAFLAFSPALFNGFVNWDDDVYVLNNPLLQSWSWTSLKAMLLGSYAHYYAPLTFLSYAAEYQASGTHPFLYHLDNVLLHALNAWLAYRFCLLLGGKRAVALAAAALFALHPLRVESVAWVTERKDLLYSLFYLLSMNCYLRYLDEGYKTRLLWFSCVLFFCSLMSKPMAVTLPLVLFIIDFYRRRALSMRMAVEKLPYAILAALFVKITWASQGHSLTAAGKLLPGLELALHNIFFYIGKILLPLNLSALYPAPQFGDKLASPALFLTEAALLALIVWGAWRWRENWRELSFGLAFFAAALLPIIQLVPIGWASAADRYTYLPALGLSFAAAELFLRIHALPRLRKVAGITGISVLLALGAMSFARCFVWKDSITLWGDVLTKHPGSTIALNNRGKALLAAGRFEEAEENFAKALASHNDSIIFLSNHAAALARLGRYDQALKDLSRAIELMPDSATLHNNRGAVYLLKKEPKKGLKDFERALELQPNHTDARINRETALELQKQPLSGF